MNRIVKYIPLVIWIMFLGCLILILGPKFFPSIFKKNVNYQEKLYFSCEDFSMKVGETSVLLAGIDLENTEALIEWKSDNSDVVDVQDGVVKAKKEGTATITVNFVEYNVSKSCNISVDKALNEEEQLKISDNTVSLIVGQKYTLKTNTDSKILKWRSGDEKVVTVDNGVITAVGKGKAVITVTTNNENNKSQAIVIVKEKSVTNNSNNTTNNSNNNTNSTTDNKKSVSEIKLDSSNLTMHVKETKTLKATIYPNNASDKNIIWTSSNEKVATVKDGAITGVSEGKTTITAKTSNGKTVNCTVTVKDYDKIHFIGNGNAFTTFINGDKVSGGGPSPSETVVLESNGKFALIDAGLPNGVSGNKNRATNVVNYLKKIGATQLEFVIITHIHADHVGGANYIIGKIPAKKVYMKTYLGKDNASSSTITENFNRYNKLYNTAKSAGAFEEIDASSEGKTITLGSMQIKILAAKNIMRYSECQGDDENTNSIFTYITVNGKKIMMTGDAKAVSEGCLKKFNPSCSGKSITECVINKNNINNIDILKVPHHGYISCDINSNIVGKLQPKYIVVGNWQQKVEYYYYGVINSSGKKVGPLSTKANESCVARHFKDYSIGGTNKRVVYVNNNNVVFDLTDNIKVYNN